MNPDFLGLLLPRQGLNVIITVKHLALGLAQSMWSVMSVRGLEESS